MKFGFDIDDTLIDLRGHAFGFYKQLLKQEVNKEVWDSWTNPEIHELFGLTREQGNDIWMRHKKEIYFSSCPIFPHAKEMLQELVDQGHEVFYITARSKEYCEETKAWLVQNGFPLLDRNFYCGMHDVEKVDLIRKLDLDYYFDDKPTVLYTIIETHTKVYVKNTPYNQHVSNPRIHSWEELRDILNSITN